MPEPSVRVRECTKLFDMRDGYPFARNVLGFSDPSMAWIEDRWIMFIGGMVPTFRTNIYSFELPPGAPVTSDQWRPSPSGVVSARRLRPIVAQPGRGSWNRCMHSVCFARGVADGETVERIYHAGRSSETVLNGRLPYRIGYLERRHGESWRSAPAPLPLHGPGLPSVLEPKVEYHDGLWRMRFLTIPAAKPGSEDPAQFRIMHTTSVNGRDGWTTPEEWFGTKDGFFDSVVVHDDNRALMAITRDSDLEGRVNNPPQGVWLSEADGPGDPRPNWSRPARVFAAEDAGYEWTARGMCAPSAVWADPEHETLSVFFAGAPRDRTWSRLAIDAVRRRRLPPFPSPVYFTIGRLDLDVGGSSDLARLQ
ncbi:hypothetical protein [Microbacterium sp.]|uniref:hypothetical protein n=1 Tax=Microbacterium sp. TaxID=51671 RepID=UPI003F718986